ncbi:MAG: restriction endonuclease subunit S [Lachnospiraceae bacterium]|nr:restriction endonuclease subunit S [Lachnospiraceae bacterium]
MKTDYKVLGNYIRLIDERNKNLSITNLQGVSITKKFIPSIANIVGTDLSNYKIVRTGQFAYGPVTSRNGEKISIAYLEGEDCIISSSYTVFEVENKEELNPEYLMLWFSRPEFDRYARYKSHGSVREIFDWNELCMIELPVPTIEEQRNIVKAYKTIIGRIALKQKVNDNLDVTAQTLYQEFFIDNSDSSSWKQGTVGDVLQLQRGHDLPRIEMVGGEYPVAGSTGTIGYHNKFTAEAPVIVMGRSGNIGNPRLYLCNCWTHNTSLYVKQIYQVEPIWAFYLLKNLNYDGFVGGSAVPTLNRNDVHAYGIAIPPLELQKSFSEKVMKLIHCKEENLSEIEKLQELQGVVLATISSR